MSHTSSELADSERAGRRTGAATIELNRPQVLNAWNAQLGADLRAAVEQVAADDAVRAVLITGAGRAFSSGADLRDMSGGFDDAPTGAPTCTARSPSATTRS